jgi:hypothetical protein
MTSNNNSPNHPTTLSAPNAHVTPIQLSHIASQIPNSTAVDAASQRMNGRQLDRILRQLPIDGFGHGCTEQEKLTVVEAKIMGDARELLGNEPLSTVEGLLSSLQVTYGKDYRSTIMDVKQKFDESVRLFAHRLRACLRTMGWVDNPDKPNLVSREFL